MTNNNNFSKVCEVGSIKIDNRLASIFIKIEFNDDKLSITGVEGALSNGNALGSCGQIEFGYWHFNQLHNDRRYADLKMPDDINYTDAWDSLAWVMLLNVWSKYHLNDMTPGCVHQEKLKKSLKSFLGNEFFNADNYSRVMEISEFKQCSVDGYCYGSAWKRTEIPANIISFLESLPRATRQPAWV